MSLSNGASSTTLSQQKTQLPNPFDLTDSQILDKVYLSHAHDDEECDRDTLLDLVSIIILKSQRPIPLAKYKPEFPTLKLISCQMITTRGVVHCAHQTTMWILQHLRSFSWDAKALITVAAFSLEYGNFRHLQIPTSDQLGNALKQLNQVNNGKLSDDITELATVTVRVLQHLKEWAAWSAAGYDTEDVPALSDALQVIPFVVYWTIASIVASTGNLIGVSDYKLSDFKDKLDRVVKTLNDHLDECKKQIDVIDNYNWRRKAFENPKDIVDLLKLLIHSKGSPIPQIYDGRTTTKTDIEVFKQKYVLLFISSLDSIDDEIRLLNSIYDRLKEDPKEVKGFNKEDFKILWIPIVDSWDKDSVEKYKTLKTKIKWYAVEFLSLVPGIRLVREVLKFETKPIIPVISPQGKRINDNAMDIIFEWGVDAFPFRKEDGDQLTQKWKWFWDVIKKVNPAIQVEPESYIFIYGGTDNKWIQDFTLAVDKVKRHDTIKRADAIIEHHQLAKDDSIVPRFWIGIESKTHKKHQEAVDCQIQTIVKSLLCLKRDPQGWAILSKGNNVKILGHGEPMLQTLTQFESWKDKVLEKEGFDIALKEFYDGKVESLSYRQPCEYLNIDSQSSSVIATITCPNPTCGRVMEVTSVNYRCCHRDGQKIC
uniref:Sieve element occlusion by forisomes 1 n=1 Tax=Dipteryx panamensis TaxID=105942 RepID=A0A023ULV7_9FABA|nr:sieve element occlusion by forisomes 1 [Dipteryx panamensis]